MFRPWPAEIVGLRGGDLGSLRIPIEREAEKEKASLEIRNEWLSNSEMAD